MCRHGSGVLVAPCGSGKTALAAALIAHWKQPSLVLVHTRQLATQTADAMQHWLGIVPGMIGDGEFNLQPITVGIVQSLAGNRERMDAIKDKFGLVLLDEAHHAPAATFTEVISQFPAAFRYGVTATPDRADGLGPFVEHTIGPIRHIITQDDLQAAGVLVRPRIIWIPTEFQYLGYPSEEWVEMIGKLTEDESRNTLLLGVIQKLVDDGRRIIALSERVRHAELLAAKINTARPGAAVVITGKMGKKQREAAFEQVRSGEARAMFSTRLGDEGLNLPALDVLVLCTPSRNAARTSQRVGRVLRSADGKRQPLVIDVVDARIGVLWSQARTRFFECYRHIAPNCRLPNWLERSKKKVA